MKNKILLSSMGDSAITVSFGNEINLECHQKVRALLQSLERQAWDFIKDCIPSYTTITVCYDPYKVVKSLGHSMTVSAFALMQNLLTELIDSLDEKPSQAHSKLVEIPVCYQGEFALDLDFVAQHCRLSPQEVIRQHSSSEYLVYMLGFAPSFSYLGGLPSSLTTPRRQQPRLLIPAGAVGIAGSQTGVYPLATPGGWQLIGRTPLALFLPQKNPPCLLRAGDRVRFCPISSAEYYHYLEERP